MAHLSFSTIDALRSQYQHLDLAATLRKLEKDFPGTVTFSTSFSYEDQVITDLIAKWAPGISLFTLDTGRLFTETYSTWSRTLEKYGLRIKAYYPDKKQLQHFVTENGPNAFYNSVDQRKRCCHIRKVAPLKRALEGQQVWITGLRAEHSPGRKQVEQWKWDEAHGLVKYHPLLHWSTAAVKAFIEHHQVPYNPLHEKGFVSIGCAPCTRAIREGEDFRAGRWWWEEESKKECGLHTH